MAGQNIDESDMNHETSISRTENRAARELGLDDVVDFFWKRKLVVIVTAFIVTTIAIIVAFTSEPVYRAETVLAPVSEGGGNAVAALAGQFSGLASLAGINLGGGGAKEEALGILRSHALVARFIEENALLRVLYREQWDADSNEWRVSNPEDAPTLWRAATRFQEKILTISQDPVSGLVTLRVEWTDPAVAAQWARELTEMTNSIVQRRAIDEGQRSIEFLQKELARTNIIEVQQAISRVIEGQLKALALATARHEFAFRVIDPPAVPDKPISPRKRLMAAVGLVLGTMLGMLLATVQAIIQRKLAVRKGVVGR